MSKAGFRRLWQILPGLTTWLTLISLAVLTFINPPVVTLIILVYAIYWLIRVVIMAFFLIYGYIRYKQEIAIDWLARLDHDFSSEWQELYHLVIIPSYKEDISILHQTLNSISNSQYPNQKLIVVVAFEDREKDLAPRYAPILTREYEHSFSKFLITFHPSDIANEVKGKGPNITWAARQVKEYLQKKKLDFNNVITTTLDADNRVDAKYFANVSWSYLHDDDPFHKSFQPLPMYFNNIWKVPLPVKMTALGSSFWQMITAVRPHHARNFSAHAQSFAALVETDFWSVTTIVEDGHQYWRSFFKFKGNHHIVPIFVPVYMDAVQGNDIYDTFREQYLQRRRWFWGVSDIPFVAEQSWGNSDIPFFYKWLQFGRLFESHFSLATQSFILWFGWLPLTVSADFRQTVLGYNFPNVYRHFLLAAWTGLIATMAISASIVPPRPGKKSIYYLSLLKEWILAPVILPISSIFFAAIPAIDSQTRLMFNKPFTVFNVTKKTAVAGGVLRVDA